MTNHNSKIIPQQRPTVPQKPNVTAVFQAIQGPLPEPKDFAQYEQILPGSADRIVRMAESQASHRQEMERQMIFANIRSERRGQWFGLIATTLVLGAVCFSVYFKQPLAASLLGVGGISSLISSFITATKKSKSDQPAEPSK